MNVDKANEIGSQILESMIGESILDYTFRRKQQANTLNDKTYVKFNEGVKVDYQLLFQRLLVVGERCDELPLVLKHELCSYPPALFEEPGMIRLANKSLLADAMWDLLGDHPQDPTVKKCSVFSMEDHLCIGLYGIEVLPTVAYAHNTSRMCEDGTVMPFLYSMATKLEHQQRT